MAPINSLRSLPSVEQLLSSGSFDRQIDQLSRLIVTTVVRNWLEEIRRKAKEQGKIPKREEIVETIGEQLDILCRRKITKVINATGILIHTNLGRAPLGRKLFEQVAEQVAGYNTLEFDLKTGKRGKRGSFLSFLLAQLTGSEAALAVNNNAAALFLILNTFANRKEVIVSRSELVQIGGGFRIPDIIRRAGAKLVETGTTNKTNIADYEDAISSKAKMLLKVHRSNFSLSGFVEDVSVNKLAMLAKKHNLVSTFDLGSGAFHQTEKFGMDTEPNIIAALRSKADLVCFSGDKLFGSVQAGIILGSEKLIKKLHKNPIYRTLRLDKLTIAMLEETVLAYLKKSDQELLPLWKYISKPSDTLRKRAEKIKSQLRETPLKIKVKKSTATPGGGALPGGELESVAIVITPPGKAQAFNRRLLDSSPPLIGYLENEEIHLDLRTIDPSEDQEVIRILTEVSNCTR